MKIKLKDKIFNYRFATKRDIDEIYRFDQIINKDLDDKKYYQLHDKENLLKKLNSGKIIVVFYNNTLVAWAIVFTTINEKSFSNLELTSKTSKFVGFLAATAVSKKYRGYGLQRFLIKKRLDYLKTKNKKFAFIGVDPNNNYSINNIKESGFRFLKEVTMDHRVLKNNKIVIEKEVYQNYKIKL